jgi:NAD(P)-dependent dehydrogenase (short-subunit alcohol dehydrogenase family)
VVSVPKTVAIFGVGPGLGMSVARRFGREGFAVALVGRNRARLDGFAADLAGEGITARAFTADLSDPVALIAAVDAIEAGFGAIDVVEIGTSLTRDAIVPVADVAAENLRYALDALLLGPIAVVRKVLPGLQPRGGMLLFAYGISAKVPMPALGNIGIALAGLRNYVHALAGTLAGTGVHVGALAIGVGIARSDAAAAFAASATDRPLALTDPDELAERYWDMYLKRDRVEDTVGALGQ